MSNYWLLRGGEVVEPGARQPRRADVLLDGDRIAAVDPGLAQPEGGQVWDVSGLLLFPGLVDLHTHLREPGFEHKETVATGTRGAAAGGFTEVVAMPNLVPPPDTPEQLERLQALLARDAIVGARAMGCITRGREGREVADIAGLKAAGAVAVSDDGNGIQDAAVGREAFRRCYRAGLPLVQHCEVNSLSEGGVINEGAVSRALGVGGLPRTAEEAMLARDIVLAAETGAHLHVAHISSARSVELVEWARRKGIEVTAEVTPHHLALTDQDVKTLGPMGKMKPPLTTPEDREALRAGLAAGIIDVVATDHAPHTLEEKERGLQEAPFGIAALETAFSVLFTELVGRDYLSPNQLARVMSQKPAELLGLSGGDLAPGSPASLVLVDPEAEWTVDREQFLARGRNNPFHQRRLRGKVEATVRRGQLVYASGSCSQRWQGKT